MDIDFPKPKISLRQAASEKLKYFMNFSVFFLISAWEASWVPAPKHPIQKSIVIPIKVFVNIYDLSVYGLVDATYAASVWLPVAGPAQASYTMCLSPRLDNFYEKIGAKTPMNNYNAIHC